MKYYHQSRNVNGLRNRERINNMKAVLLIFTVAVVSWIGGINYMSSQIDSMAIQSQVKRNSCGLIPVSACAYTYGDKAGVLMMNK